MAAAYPIQRIYLALQIPAPMQLAMCPFWIAWGAACSRSACICMTVMAMLRFLEKPLFGSLQTTHGSWSRIRRGSPFSFRTKWPSTAKSSSRTCWVDKLQMRRNNVKRRVPRRSFAFPGFNADALNVTLINRESGWKSTKLCYLPPRQ